MGFSSWPSFILVFFSFFSSFFYNSHTSHTRSSSSHTSWSLLLLLEPTISSFWTEDHLILLDFVGYYLCKLIVRHCLIRVCDGGLKERFSSSMCSSSTIYTLMCVILSDVQKGNSQKSSLENINNFPKTTYDDLRDWYVNECHTDISATIFFPFYKD